MDINGMQDPAFVRWLRETGQSRPIKPDELDFDWSVPATTTAEQAHQWRQAQARKLIRLYVGWRASQNERIWRVASGGTAMPSDPSPTQPDAGREVFAPDEVSDALIQLREARIDTLETALRAALEVRVSGSCAWR